MFDEKVGPPPMPNRRPVGPNDAGALQVAISIDVISKRILLEFPVPVTMIGMTADETEALVRELTARMTLLRSGRFPLR